MKRKIPDAVILAAQIVCDTTPPCNKCVMEVDDECVAPRRHVAQAIARRILAAYRARLPRQAKGKP